MFEKFFGSEKEEIKEPEAPAETARAAGIDPQTGVVMNEQEVKQDRKEKLEDPTRFRDLR